MSCLAAAGRSLESTDTDTHLHAVILLTWLDYTKEMEELSSMDYNYCENDSFKVSAK
jgi:hypothetical protein